MALTNLSQALLHTKAVEDYAKLPPVYEKLKEWKKATLAYLRLALYQLQAGKEAITTLEHCKELSPELKIDTVLMALDPSPTRVAKAIQRAPKQDHEEAIAIYKQVILYSPRALSAYEALIPLLKDPTEKKEYLLKAAECATRVGKPELAEKFREMAGKRTSITLKEWANPRLLLDKIERDSPRFKRLEEFMKGPCPIWRGKTARETHGFALRFQNFIITEDGSSVEVPRTLEGLDQCDKASNGHGFSTLWQKIEHLRPTSFEEEEYEFIVFTMDVLPGSLGMDYASQKELVESKGYEVPSIIDAATYILWESRLSRTALFASLYTRCRENINGSQLVLGHFSHRGLSVDFSLCNSKLDCYGMAGFLKF